MSGLLPYLYLYILKSSIMFLFLEKLPKKKKIRKEKIRKEEKKEEKRI